MWAGLPENISLDGFNITQFSFGILSPVRCACACARTLLRVKGACVCWKKNKFGVADGRPPPNLHVYILIIQYIKTVTHDDVLLRTGTLMITQLISKNLCHTVPITSPKLQIINQPFNHTQR